MSDRDWLIEQAKQKLKQRREYQHLFDAHTNLYKNIPREAIEALAKASSSHAARAIVELARSPVFQSNIKAFENVVLPTINRQAAEAIRSSAMLPAIQTHAVKLLLESAQAMKGVNFQEIIEALAKRSSIDYERIGGIANSAALAAFKQIQPEMPRMFDAINGKFAGMIAEALHQALEKRDEESFAKVEALINDKFASLPQNQETSQATWQTFLTILSILLAFGSFGLDIYQAIDTHESSINQPAQVQQLSDLLRQIAHNTEQHIPEKDKNIYYVVERTVDLKVKPQCKSATITPIGRNQKVRLVQMNHKWIYVEYFDYLDGIPKYGWANKKYLNRVEN